jgi:hypothetical protein
MNSPLRLATALWISPWAHPRCLKHDNVAILRIVELDQEIMIIVSGPLPNPVAGARMALPKGRFAQYVAGRNIPAPLCGTPQRSKSLPPGSTPHRRARRAGFREGNSAMMRNRILAAVAVATVASAALAGCSS